MTEPIPRQARRGSGAPISCASARRGRFVTPFRLQRLDHVSLNVSDRARSIAWYCDVLGLELKNDPKQDDWPAFMGEFGACVGLFQAQSAPAVERDAESVGFRHLAFMVGKDDL